MPSYDYHCRACGHVFTVRERIAEHAAERTTCSVCGSHEVERVLSGFYPRTPRKS